MLAYWAFMSELEQPSLYAVDCTSERSFYNKYARLREARR